MNKIGIRAHDIGQYEAFTLARKIKKLGFTDVQLVFNKVFKLTIDKVEVKTINEAFKDLNITMLGAYFNPVHPDTKEVEDGIENFKKHIQKANLFKAKSVGTETGSLMGKPWGYVKENHDEETLNKLIPIIKVLVNEAENHQTTVALEGAYNHVVYNPKVLKKVVDAINSQHLKVTIDLFNFLHIGNYRDRNNIFIEAINLLQDDIIIYHLKDFIIEDNTIKQVGLGQGLMDYPFLIKKIKEKTPHATLIFEGVTSNDIETSFNYIKRLLEEE